MDLWEIAQFLGTSDPADETVIEEEQTRNPSAAKLEILRLIAERRRARGA